VGSNHRSPPCHRGVLPAERRDCPAAPRPGVEPGTPRSKRGMMSVSPPGRQWTAGDLHPDFRHAKPASSCWTSSPIHAVETVGIEPTPACLQDKLANPWYMRPHKPTSAKGPPGDRTRSSSLPKRRAAATPADQPCETSASAGDNRLGRPACLYRRPQTFRPTVAEVGIEPTDLSPGSRPGRFTGLRTRPSISPGPR
jgi:hypothetical protein